MGPARFDAGPGPALHVVASVPRNGQGVNCGAGDLNCGVPVDTPITLRFDRILLPATAVRQSIVVYSGAPGVGAPFLQPSYDVLERELTFRMAGRFEATALYRVQLPIARSASDYGLRAFDGAPLESGRVPVELSFVTSAALMDAAPSPAFDEPTCDDVAALLASHCAGSCCHGGESPAMGLRLDSVTGIEATAIQRVAHQTETGNTLGVPFVNPSRFGVAMPIIDPGSAASSYLVYKLLLSPDNLRACAAGACSFDALPGAQSCAPLPADERDRLAAWFVQGDAMPIVAHGADPSCLPPDNRALDCGEMRALTRWIDRGARCP